MSVYVRTNFSKFISRLLLLSLALQPGGGLFLSVLCAFAVIPKENVKSAKLLSNVKGVDE